ATAGGDGGRGGHDVPPRYPSRRKHATTDTVATPRSIPSGFVVIGRRATEPAAEFPTRLPVERAVGLGRALGRHGAERHGRGPLLGRGPLSKVRAFFGVVEPISRPSRSARWASNCSGDQPRISTRRWWTSGPPRAK